MNSNERSTLWVI